MIEREGKKQESEWEGRREGGRERRRKTEAAEDREHEEEGVSY